MNKSGNDNPVYGLTGRYEEEEKFILAVREAVRTRYTRIETYSPFPIHGLSKILGHKNVLVQWAVFWGGLIGGLSGFYMQYFANVIDYPHNIGGRPFNSWPAFIPITFELTVLFGALSGFAAFLISCRLPQLYHPMFNIKEFERATVDNFFLLIRSDDKNFHLQGTREFLEKTQAKSVHEVNKLME